MCNLIVIVTKVDDDSFNQIISYEPWLFSFPRFAKEHLRFVQSLWAQLGQTMGMYVQRAIGHSFPISCSLLSAKYNVQSSLIILGDTELRALLSGRKEFTLFHSYGC